MASRLSAIFARNRKCFIPFVTAGHPDLEVTEKILIELAEVGSHIIEIGIPFSDPIADGPIIQQSSFRALRHDYAFGDYIELVRRVRQKTEVGLIFMTYLNPVWKYGLERVESEAIRAGLDGILISDLTPEEYERVKIGRRTFLKELDTVFLAAPTSSDARLKRICGASRGFVYLVARTGVTGKRSDVETLVPPTVTRIRRLTQLPIAVGFGITSAEDVAKVWQYAEGAVVGSAIVGFIEDNWSDGDLPQKVREYVKKCLIPGVYLR